MPTIKKNRAASNLSKIRWGKLTSEERKAQLEAAHIGRKKAAKIRRENKLASV